MGWIARIARLHTLKRLRSIPLGVHVPDPLGAQYRALFAGADAPDTTLGLDAAIIYIADLFTRMIEPGDASALRMPPSTAVRELLAESRVSSVLGRVCTALAASFGLSDVATAA